MKYEAWIIYQKEDAEKNAGYIQWFQEECYKKEINLRLIHREQLVIGIFSGKLAVFYEGNKLALPNFAIVRTIDHLFSKQLESMGINVFNPSSVSEICNHKGKTHQKLASLGIPMVNTIFTKKSLFSLENSPLTLPLIIKDVHGRGGKQVRLIQSNEQLEQVLVEITSCEIIIQELTPTLGKDVRVFVIGKEIIAAVLRYNPHSYKANYTLGGKIELYSLTEEEKALVQTIIEQFDFGMVGIDFLFDENDGFLFNEIEDIVGSRSLSKLSSINLLEKYVEFILKSLE